MGVRKKIHLISSLTSLFTWTERKYAVCDSFCLFAFLFFWMFRWFTREEIIPALERAGSPTGASFLNPDADAEVPFVLAPVYAIAHFIIRAWALREVDVLAEGHGSVGVGRL